MEKLKGILTEEEKEKEREWENKNQGRSVVHQNLEVLKIADSTWAWVRQNAPFVPHSWYKKKKKRCPCPALPHSLGSTAWQFFTSHCRESLCPEFCTPRGALRGNAICLSPLNDSPSQDWFMTRHSGQPTLYGPCHWVRTSGGLCLTC